MQSFTREDLSSIPSPSFRNDESISSIKINENSVYEKLCALKVNKAPGPDGFHSYVLKSCASSICTPLTILYQQSLSSGELPDEWKQAHIIPVFKKGRKNQAANYRPISLTSIVVKVLESIIRSELITFCTNSNILSYEQHGFVGRKSCFTNLLKTFEEWTSAMDEGFGIDVIYLDYSKAFDSVPHKRLIALLHADLTYSLYKCLYIPLLLYDNQASCGSCLQLV